MDIDKIVYDKSVIDFVTIAVELCIFLEEENPPPREEWTDRILKLLPLLYVKALLLPETVATGEELPEQFVSEAVYYSVANRILEVMGEEDVFLDVFVEDMKYSDTPVSSNISENIADIYQDLRDFVSIYQYGLTSTMNDALYYCKENFFLYWGQKLVNVLRPLHALQSGYMEKKNDGMDFLEEAPWD